LGVEVLVDEAHAYCTFADRRGDTLDRVASYVADGEHSGKRRLERQARRTFA
jgi:hypothetical protein